MPNTKTADPPAPASPGDPITLRRADIYGALGKLAIMIAVVAACVAVIHLTDLRQVLDNTSRLKSLVQGQGAWGPFYFIAASALLILIGMPRLLFCALGGMLFGFVEGLVYSQLATITGAYGTFLFARWGTQRWVERLKQKQSRVYRMLENPNMLTVFLSRQLPTGGVLISLLLGFSSVSHLNFVVGSILGFLPEAIPAVLIGSGAGKASMMLAFAQILTAAAVLVLAGFVILRLSAAYKERMRQRQRK